MFDLTDSAKHLVQDFKTLQTLKLFINRETPKPPKRPTLNKIDKIRENPVDNYLKIGEPRFEKP